MRGRVRIGGLALLLVTGSARAEEPEHPTLEIGASAGIALPHCLDHCAGELHAGRSWGAIALIRPVPWGAIGVALDVAYFPWEATDSDYRDGGAEMSAGFVGFAGRWYFLRGMQQAAWAHAALGVASVDSDTQTLRCKNRLGPAMQLGAGYDVLLGAGLRVTTSAVGVIGRPMSDCEDVFIPNDPPATPLAVPALMLRLGLTLGVTTKPSTEEL